MSLDPTKQYFTKYTDSRLGSGFTGENSANTVTEKINSTIFQIITTSATSLTAETSKYYMFESPVSNLVVNLPIPLNNSILNSIKFYFTTSDNNSIIFDSVVQIVYKDDFYVFEDNKTYEVESIYNGNVWILSLTEIITSHFDKLVDYIESKGSQYINTEVIPSGKIISSEIKFQLTSTSTSAPTVLGSGVNDGTDNCRLLGLLNGEWRFKIGGNNFTASTADTNLHIVKSNTASGTYLDTTIVDSKQTIIPNTNTRPLYLFDDNGGGGTSSCCKLYYCKIYEGGVLIRDFVPVRIGTVEYLWDKVNKKLYANGGSGAFDVGPDK